MRLRIPYRQCKASTYIKWALVLSLIIITACNDKAKQNNTAQDSAMVMDSSMKHTGMHMNHEQTDTASNENYWNTLPVNRTVIAKQAAVQPVIADMNFTINGNGYITFDTRSNRKIAVRIGGRVERLYVKYNYEYVHKGEKILELYSPELNTYVEEYLYVSKQTTDSVLQNRAKQKLLLLGLTPLQVKQIDETGQTSFTIPIYSPYAGYVLFNPSTASGMSMNQNKDASGSMGSMGEATASSSAVTASELPDNSIREGMYVNKDQTLFWINDFKEAWGIIAFTKENEKYIHQGQTVMVNSELLPDQPLKASIQSIEQVYGQGQKFTQARVYLTNSSQRLKQNSLINAIVSVPVKALMVPASSVYYLGNVSIVWVKTGTTKEGNNVFQSRIVKTGHRTESEVEILEGLHQNELIAKDAGYLTDSESIINY